MLISLGNLGLVYNTMVQWLINIDGEPQIEQNNKMMVIIIIIIIVMSNDLKAEVNIKIFYFSRSLIKSISNNRGGLNISPHYACRKKD